MIDKSVTDKIDALDNRYVLDIVTNYKAYGYDREVREYARKVLKERNVPGEEMSNYREEEEVRESALARLTDELKEYFRIMTIAGVLANLALIGVIAVAILPVGPFVYFNLILLVVFLVITGIYDGRIIERSARIKELQPAAGDTPDDGEFEVSAIPSYFFMIFLPVYFPVRMFRIVKFLRSLEMTKPNK